MRHVPSLWLGLRVKFLLFALSVVFPLVLLVIGDYWRERDLLFDQVSSQTQILAAATGATLAGGFDDAIGVAWTLSTDADVASLEPGRATARLRIALSRLPGYENLAVWRADGSVVASAVPPSPGPAVSVADFPHVRQVMATNEATISTIVRSPILAGRAVVVAVAPVRDGAGQPIGTAHVAIDFATLLRRVDEARVAGAEAHAFTVVGPLGRVAFTQLRPDLPFEERDLSGFAPVQAALRGQTVIDHRQTTPLAPGEFVAVWMPAPRYGWVVGSAIPTAVALAPAETTLRARLVGSALIFALVTALAVVLSGFLLRPILLLGEFCKRIGRGEYGGQLRLRTGDELEELAGIIDVMSTQLVEREEERQRFNRMREEFISIVAHDLRAPITVIGGYAQFLARAGRAADRPAEEQRALETIRTSADRLNRMVADLLDASRIEAQRLRLEPRPLELNELVQMCVAELGPSLAPHPVRVTPAPGRVMIHADPQRLDQVLTNLLTNAAKYSPPEAPIDVMVRTADGRAQVLVVDRGRGIPPDELPHLFARFYRVGEAGAEGREGLGLGLYIARGLVEAHGGQLTAESEVGRGSTFTVSLPLNVELSASQ